MKGQVIQSRIESNLSFWAGGLFEEGNVSQEQCNHSECESYLSPNINICEINSILDILHNRPIFLKWNATIKTKIEYQRVGLLSIPTT